MKNIVNRWKSSSTRSRRNFAVVLRPCNSQKRRNKTKSCNVNNNMQRIFEKKRAMIEERIEQNMEMAKAIEEKKKNDFLERQQHFETIRQQNLEKQEEERRLKAQELMLQEQRRQMILQQQRKEEEKKAAQLLNKFEEEEEHVAEIQDMREREQGILRERKNLRSQMKLENVQRVQRIGEYKRMGTLKKIEDNDGRIKSMIEQRRALIKERREAARATKLQKEAIAKVMEEVRTNASKANKIITQALSGKITLESLTAPPTSPGGRSKSASVRRLKNTTSADSLGLAGGRTSKSAGDNTEDFNGKSYNIISYCIVLLISFIFVQ
mmetsp:Transcript_31455/g.45274  ORF Transcript_31455/g.45274 Transcript_31455/m.45274 type:complete len:324 (-) Transcript_31455:212-1183(-)